MASWLEQAAYFLLLALAAVPLLRQPWLVEAASRLRSPALFVVGTGDATYVPQALERIRKITGAQAILLEGANHSLEYPGDLMRSLQYIHEVVRDVNDFLDRKLA